MKTELMAKDIELVCAHLSSNVQYLLNELEDRSGTTSFSQTGNTILYMVLPQYKNGCNVTQELSIKSLLDEVALIKIMHQQTLQLVRHVEKKDPEFAAWIEGIIMRFIKKSAIKIVERRSHEGLHAVGSLT